jgi:hypothetical protein
MVKKCWQYDAVSGVMVHSSAGQRAIIVHARREIGFLGGAKLVYNSEYKS